MGEPQEDTSPSDSQIGRQSGSGTGADVSRLFDAATVTQRWWEGNRTGQPGPAKGSASTASGSREARSPLPPPPPPPPPPAGWSPSPSTTSAEQAAGPSQAQLDAARMKRLEQELVAAREEATALHEMLEDLPEIFERKFRQRLHGIMEQQQLLLADNRMLRDQLFALQPAASQVENRTSRMLPPAAESLDDDEGGRRRTLQRMVHGMLRLGQKLRTGLGDLQRNGADQGPERVSDRDDGMPRAA